ncbi:VanZ family protein [Candidatus Nitrospira bockiana]
MAARRVGTERRGRIVRYWVPVGLYAALIFVLSSLSVVPGVLEGANDKVLHTLEYSVLGALSYRAFRFGAGSAPAAAFVWAVLFSTAYGLTDEIHQAFVPSRQPDPWDWLVDVMGSALGAATWHAGMEARRPAARR